MAFVTGPSVRVSSSASAFTGGDVCTPTRTSARPSAARAPTMRVLDGLDTVTQQPYTFSRYILGPFQGVTLSPNAREEERVDVMAAIYRQVFANAYIMEEERAELAVAESQFKLGALSVKEFVRTLAKSYAYKSRFFEGASNYRFIEMNHMHLLGRAPDGFADMRKHNAILQNEGFDAEIDSYIDSAEYETIFGDDTVPFLRFRGAYTPCDSFNKQCALKGGWANSDKAMGGAALSGYNGSDGRQMSTLISSYIAGVPVPAEAVAQNTPLRSTAPNWYAVPDPALAPTPAFVSVAEVAALQEKVTVLQSAYTRELSRKKENGTDSLSTFRGMVKEMAPMLDRGFAYSGGDPLLANPYAKQLVADESPLAEAGQKSSDYKSYMARLENDSLSRIEKDLENAKAELRVLEKALKASTPMDRELVLPGQVSGASAAGLFASSAGERPRITATRARPAAAVVTEASGPLAQVTSVVGSTTEKVGAVVGEAAGKLKEILPF